MTKKQKTFWGEIGIAAVGAAIGGVIAVLSSPKNGKQNRAVVAKEAKQVANQVKKVVASQKKKVAVSKKKK